MRCSKLRKSLYVVAMLLLFVGLFGGCVETPAPPPTEEPSEEIVPIAKLKIPEWEEFAGQEVTVEGIFVRDPVPMLVTELDVVLMNMPMPVDQYILLTEKAAEELTAEEYGGAPLRLTGEVVPAEKIWEWEPYAALTPIHYEILEHWFEPYHPKGLFVKVKPWELLWPDKYAVLFSGGYNALNNHARYWNDLKFMYSTLINTLGYDPDNITVLYADGNAKDNDMPVHHSATEANLNTAFDDLRDTTKSTDSIFVFTTNHGGGYNPTEPDGDCIHGGQWDADDDEPAADVLVEQDCDIDINGDGDKLDQESWDEVLYSWGGSILDDDLQDMAADLYYSRMTIVMEQCFSGGLIADIAQGGDDLIIMSAAGEYESSWAMAGGNYDEFSYYFTCAINGEDPNGNTVDADANNDGSVSMVEAFNYARTNDSRNETPWYEDSGDGTPHSGNMPAGGDGALGETTFP